MHCLYPSLGGFIHKLFSVFLTCTSGDFLLSGDFLVSVGFSQGRATEEQAHKRKKPANLRRVAVCIRNQYLLL
jgi:hypothetical protein